MARRSVTPSGAPATAATTTVTPSTTTSTPAPKTTPATSSNAFQNVFDNLLQHYLKATPQRTKLLDAFMAFLVAVGVLQFLYCVLAGNYPFNAFLSGFSSTVGQFVLTASLRIQTTDTNKSDFPAVSPERAFADYVVCSLILHFFCINFIN
ncbi:dad family protein [Ophiostoma piceae UAMH 11346]|uniref:Dolichyl-diphosphooligosaccharide--protein glycosyltransferase subunit OST2 n=1 Tax=Ophiostoma piceae (strain UAMH 11346) TaxID=1262450 RepID=S3BZ90_OPHP1|nr:dad family protein [Ophiostoma piceae UAMH 11346]